MTSTTIKPVIMAVDDEAAVLSAIVRDLRRQYGGHYRVLSSASAATALTTLSELAKRRDPVAMVISDQRMPELEGVEMLERAIALVPDAKKVLLTAYADTQAAIDAINRVGLDHYFMKPWDPPDELLFPVVDDLLADWASVARLPWQGIRVAGSRWSSAAHRIRAFLAKQRVPFLWLDVDADAAVRAEVEEAAGGELRLPTVFFPDGRAVVRPDDRQLAAELGLRTEAQGPFYDVVVVGAGPAGMATAVYAAAEGLDCLVVEREAPGGLAATAPRIDNYLGFPTGISGRDLTSRAVAQAERLGAEIISGRRVTGVRVEEPYRVIQLDDASEVTCHTLVLASGAEFRVLDVPGARQLTGSGIYYGASHGDRKLLAGEEVAVIGGGNAAAEAALYLARSCSRVHLLVRGEKAVASRYLLDEIDLTAEVELRLGQRVEAALGEGRLSALELRDGSGEKHRLEVAAAFVYIGVRPACDYAGDTVSRDERGFVLTGPALALRGRRPDGWPLDRDPFLLEASTPGIFAIGDVRSGTYGRVATAAAEGGAVVSMILQHLRGWERHERLGAAG